MNKSLIIGLVFLASMMVGGYLIYPLFNVIEVDEKLEVSDVVLEGAGEDSKGLSGEFLASAHEVAGRALVVDTKDGKILRFEDFETVNGPNLHIYLATDSSGSDYIDLGEIKATKGNVNYELPGNIDLDKYDTVLVWCVPFEVLFSYAELE